MAEERLQKVIAEAGVASRRKAEDLIAQGRVRVNGEVVREMGVKVDPERDRIEVDGQPLSPEAKVYLAVHKPEGVVTTADDPEGRPTILDMLPPELGRVYPVGRLDMDSRGLVLLTNDGDLAHKLMHPSFEHEKEYRVKVAGQPGQTQFNQIRQGILLEDGMTLPADVSVIERKRDSSWLRVTLREGRKRQLRRMFDVLEHPVRDLLRVRVGPIQLGTLAEGDWRRLSVREVQALRRVADGYKVEPVTPPMIPNKSLVERDTERQKAEGRRQKAGGARREAEGRKQPAEGRKPRREAESRYAGQKAVGGRREAEGRGRDTEVFAAPGGRRKAEGGRQKAERTARPSAKRQAESKRWGDEAASARGPRGADRTRSDRPERSASERPRRGQGPRADSDGSRPEPAARTSRFAATPRPTAPARRPLRADEDEDNWMEPTARQRARAAGETRRPSERPRRAPRPQEAAEDRPRRAGMASPRRPQPQAPQQVKSSGPPTTARPAPKKRPAASGPANRPTKGPRPAASSGRRPKPR